MDGARAAATDGAEQDGVPVSAGTRDDLLLEYDLPGHAPVEQLRAVTRVAATVAGVPTAVVNLLDDCFQHQVGDVGFTGGRSAVEDSMCAIALVDERLRHVPDASREAAFAGNPWVDGRMAAVRLYASAPLRLPDGRVLGSLCVFDEQPGELTAAQLSALADLADQAVTVFEQQRLARAAAEQAAHAERARADAERQAALTAGVMDTIDVGVVACDDQGRLTLFNRAARTFHGMPEDPTVDPVDWANRYSLFDEHGTALTRDDVPLFRALVGGRVHDATIVIAPHGRDPMTVRCDGQALRDTTGRLLGAVVAMKDVTGARAQAGELVRARDQALGAARAKSAFLAAASHEIRTPLNGVLGMLDVLATGTLTDVQQEQVTVARDSGEALLHLLNDVLDLSKAEASVVSLTSAAFDPAGVAGDVVRALQATAVGKGLALGVRVTGCGDALLGDAPRLRQVLMNLVGNAIKFTDRGRVDVEVATSAHGAQRHLTLAVTDTGAGIDPAELGQLFQPFTQGAQGVRSGGTGLGLVLSRQLVELMGGRLQVTSRPGVGSTFTIELDLPVSPDAPVAAPPAPPPAPPRAHEGRRLRVLVADDNDVNLLVATAMLTAEGADVVTVEDGDDAVAAVAGGDFDLALLDMQMPRMSGTDAARAIRELPGEASAIRLVALTADASADTRSACLAAGMESVLVKPVRRAELRQVLEQSLDPAR